MSGTAALALAPVGDVVPQALTGQELFVVHSGGGRSSRRRPASVVIAALVAIVAAFGGYRAIGSVLGGESGIVGGAASRTKAGLPAAAASLHRVFKPGEQHAYKVTMTVDAKVISPGKESGDVNATALVSFTEQVVARDKAGVTTVRYTVDRATMQAGGQTVTLPLSRAGVEVTVGPNGKQLSTKPFGAGMQDLPNGGFFDLLMPVLKPGAKVGSSWTSKDTAQIRGFDALNVVTTYQLTKQSGGRAVVHSTSEAPLNLELSEAQVLGALGGGPGLGSPGKAIEMNGRFVIVGDQTVDVASGRTLSGSAKATLNALFLVDGQEKMRMTMRVAFTLSPEDRLPPSTV